MKKAIIYVVIIGSIMAVLAFIPKGNKIIINKPKDSLITIKTKTNHKIVNLVNQTNPEIIGTWINEEDTSYKLVFLDTGVLKEYVNDELMGTLNYTISHNCGSESDTSIEFLKKIESDGSIYCFEINAINVNNNGILSIRSMENGKLYIFNKVN